MRGAEEQPKAVCPSTWHGTQVAHALAPSPLRRAPLPKKGEGKHCSQQASVARWSQQSTGKARTRNSTHKTLLINSGTADERPATDPSSSEGGELATNRRNSCRQSNQHWFLVGQPLTSRECGFGSDSRYLALWTCRTPLSPSGTPTACPSHMKAFLLSWKHAADSNAQASRSRNAPAKRTGRTTRAQTAKDAACQKGAATVGSFSENLESSNGSGLKLGAGMECAAACARAGRRSSPVPTAITDKETKNLTVIDKL